MAEPIVENKENNVPPVVEPTVVEQPTPPVVEKPPVVDIDAIRKEEQDKANAKIAEYEAQLAEKADLFKTMQERLDALEDEKLSATERIKKQEERELARKLEEENQRAERERIEREKYDLIEQTNRELEFKISLTSIMEEKPHQKEKIKELMKSGLLKSEDDYLRMVSPFDKELKELHERKLRDEQINVGGNVFGTYQTTNGTDQRTEAQKKIDAYKEAEMKRLGKNK